MISNDLVYNLSAGLIVMGVNLISVIGLGIILTLLGMFFVHIAKIHSYLVLANEENVKLLNQMHEGVLILSKSENKVILSNKTSTKLI